MPDKPRLNGALRLDGYMLKSRVAEILKARLEEPFPVSPVVVRNIIITHGGTPNTVDVRVVEQELTNKVYEIRAQLHAIGVSMEDDGKLELGEGSVGAAQDGTPGVGFPLIWKPREPVVQ